MFSLLLRLVVRVGVMGFLALGGGAGGLGAWTVGAGWPELTKDELALKAPKLDPDAGVEILLREFQIDDSGSSSTTIRGERDVGAIHYTRFEHFMRVKIFNEAGLADLGNQFRLEVWDTTKRVKVYARVIQPDGTITEVEPETVMDREVYREGEYASRRLSFALPGLTVGCIVDYKWGFEEVNGLYGYTVLTRRPWPTHRFNFRVKFPEWARGAWTTRMLSPQEVKEGRGRFRGWNVMELRDLPAVLDEPYRPALVELQPSLHLYYIRNVGGRGWRDRFWEHHGKWIEEMASIGITPRARGIREQYTRLTEGMADPREQLEALYVWVQTSVKTLRADETNYTLEQWHDFTAIKSAADTLRDGAGAPRSVHKLMASLAANIPGADVRFALCNDLWSGEFDPNNRYFGVLPDLLVAVRLPKEPNWTFLDAAGASLPFGQLDWRNEGTVAQIGDSRETLQVITPVLPPDSNEISRAAQLTLDPDGSIAGTWSIRYTGQPSTERKRDYSERTPSERLERLTEELEQLLGPVSLEDVDFLGLDQLSAPLEIKGRLRIEAFADRTRTRLVFEPALFQRKSEPWFTRPKRGADIVLRYAWRERDEVRILLPEGYVFEEPSAPKGVIDEVALRHDLRMAYSAEHRLLGIQRDFRLGGSAFPQDSYPALKVVFEEIAIQDHHALTLRQVEDGRE